MMTHIVTKKSPIVSVVIQNETKINCHKIMYDAQDRHKRIAEKVPTSYFVTDSVLRDALTTIM
jgi:hypothetical protein